MYLEHFALKTPPFGPTPGAQALYLGMGHREGLAALEWGLSEPSGLTMLAGEIGAGKTTLVEALVARGWRDVRVACVSDPALEYPQMLRMIAEQLGATPASLDRFGLLRAIKALLAALAPGGRAAVIFDEAQALPDEIMDELRLLSNLGAGALAPLKIVLVGQPELVERLRDPRFRALNQRIGARAFLNPLSAAESAAYIEHRMRAAGGETRRVFSARALAEILAHAQGLPRRINIICHNAMMTAYANGHRRVRTADVQAAASEYDDLLGASRDASPAGPPDATALEAPRAVAPVAPRRRLAPLAVATAVSAALVLGAWYLVAADPQPGAASVDESVGESVAQVTAAGAEPSLAQNVQPAAQTAATSVPQTVASAAAGTGAARAGAPAAAAAEPAHDVVVRAGDTLSAIARSHLGGDSVEQIARLMRANPQINDSNLIFPGQTVMLAPSDEARRAGGSR